MAVAVAVACATAVKVAHLVEEVVVARLRKEVLGTQVLADAVAAHLVVLLLTSQQRLHTKVLLANSQVAVLVLY